MSANKKVIKIVKTTAVVVAVIIAIPLIMAIFVKKDFAVEREVTIHQPKQEVFDYIRLLKNQEYYSVWGSRDPEMNREYRGTDGTVGFVSAWHGDGDTGRGEQEITEIIDGERINFELRFIEPFESIADVYFETDSLAPDRTLVRWGFSSRMSYPMNLMLLFVDMEEMIGEDFETGLINLKSILEVDISTL